MATRRRRTQRVRHFKDGGAVPLDDVLPGFGRQEAEAVAATADEPAPPPPPPAGQSDAVFRALEAQRRAEQMQAAAAMQQPAQPPAQPQMSERRQRFLAAHPEILDPTNREAVEGYWRQALRMGLAEDTPEIDNYVLQGLHFERASRETAEERARGMHQDEPDDAPASPAPPQSRREAFQAPSSEPRRSMPITAPVTREVPTMTGKRMTDNNTLSAEERQMARDAIPDRPDLPKLSNHEKELMYLRNREKYREMVRNGTYTDQRQR
jgi:hypothetical protein